MCDLSLARFVKKVFIQAQGADPSPPLGTILGNLGVNTVTFCNSFNTFTKNLPYYFSLKVIIYIFDNKSTTFKVSAPSTSYILNLLKFDRTIKIRVFDRYNDKIISCVLLRELMKLAKYKFPHLSLNESLPIIIGTAKSQNLIIVK